MLRGALAFTISLTMPASPCDHTATASVSVSLLRGGSSSGTVVQFEECGVCKDLHRGEDQGLGQLILAQCREGIFSLRLI